MEKSHDELLSVKECMSNPVFTVEGTAPLRTAWGLMSRHKVRHLPVVNGKSVIGILSEKDIYRALPSRREIADVEVLKKALDSVLVNDIMTKNVVTVDVTDNMQQIAKKMLEKRIGCLPVMNGGGLVGIISTHDLIKHLASNGHFAISKAELATIS